MLSPIVSAASLATVYYIYKAEYKPKMTYVKAHYDGNTYLVRDLPESDKAADILAIVREKLLKLVRNLQKKYQSKNKKVNRLEKRFQNTIIQEAERKRNTTSFSVNKGRQIHLCIRDKNSNESLISLNTIMFVALHELAHVMTISIGHTEEFWTNFKFLLAHAIEWKLYDAVDYRKKPHPYCGIFIDETPLKQNEVVKYI